MNNTQMANSYFPDYLVTPGDVLEDYLDYTGITQAALADRTGLSKKTINEIVKAKSAITAETALKFERTLGRPAHFWSNLERQYQEDKVRLADKLQLENDLQWLDMFPVNAMVKHGYIEKCKDKISQLDVLLRFFAVASPKQWEIVWANDLEAVFRKTEKSEKDAAILSAWLRKGEIEAHQQRCDKFDKQKFQDNLIGIRSLTTIKESKIFVPQLESICAAAGIAVVFVPALPKLGIYGATRWINDKYVMQLSLYGKSNDQLWFTFFHEVCHIIKHSRGELYIEGDGQENKKENEADTFAQDILIPPVQLSEFLASVSTPSTLQIRRFAACVGIAPGIVVGRLQHDGVLPRNRGNDLKIRYEWVGK
jgi:addiction module HigA family antidote